MNTYLLQWLMEADTPWILPLKSHVRGMTLLPPLAYDMNVYGKRWCWWMKWLIDTSSQNLWIEWILFLSDPLWCVGIGLGMKQALRNEQCQAQTCTWSVGEVPNQGTRTARWKLGRMGRIDDYSSRAGRWRPPGHYPYRHYRPSCIARSTAPALFSGLAINVGPMRWLHLIRLVYISTCASVRYVATNRIPWFRDTICYDFQDIYWSFSFLWLLRWLFFPIPS